MYFPNFKVIIFAAFSISITMSVSKVLQAQELNQTYVNQLDLHISSTCEDGAAIFKIKNVGEDKVSGINFRLFKVTQGLLVSKRRMSLNQGQTATFKVKNADNIPDQIGIFVNTKELARRERTDASIRCST